ncbi:hypothetical protein E2562_022651 [Oryza meyeriana var. granulata]|uniref:Uncharacterized protein n=1 Tax=Oryza meyeriana var. granulata TaxID=110450 RepID=A0A6G1CRD5_9ORYZ|nr:hypothetical protein E2562_022651 [Oryza meyeriana var. granulata]
MRDSDLYTGKLVGRDEVSASRREGVPASSGEGAPAAGGEGVQEEPYGVVAYRPSRAARGNKEEENI